MDGQTSCEAEEAQGIHKRPVSDLFWPEKCKNILPKSPKTTWKKTRLVFISPRIPFFLPFLGRETCKIYVFVQVFCGFNCNKRSASLQLIRPLLVRVQLAGKTMVSTINLNGSWPQKHVFFFSGGFRGVLFGGFLCIRAPKKHSFVTPVGFCLFCFF